MSKNPAFLAVAPIVVGISNSSVAPVRANLRSLRSATLMFRVPNSTSPARFLNSRLSHTFAAEKFLLPS